MSMGSGVEIRLNCRVFSFYKLLYTDESVDAFSINQFNLFPLMKVEGVLCWPLIFQLKKLNLLFFGMDPFKTSNPNGYLACFY